MNLLKSRYTVQNTIIRDTWNHNGIVAEATDVKYAKKITRLLNKDHEENYRPQQVARN